MIPQPLRNEIRIRFPLKGSIFGLVYTKELEEGELEINNLTNLNLTLKIFGPMSESSLTVVLLLEQGFCSFIALGTGFISILMNKSCVPDRYIPRYI